MSGVLGEDNGPLLFTGQTNRNNMLRPEPCPVRKVLTSRPMSREVTVIEGRSLEGCMEAVGGMGLTSKECRGPRGYK